MAATQRSAEESARITSRRALRFVTAVVIACAVAAYASVVTFGFAYDDDWTVVHNQALDGPLAPLVRWLFTGQAIKKHVPDATRPLMVVSMWADKRLFGAFPAGYHLHSLALFCGASVAACLATFAVTRRWRAAFWGGAAFAVFPVHAEVVAAVNYREDLYAAIAVFVAVAWLFWPRRRPDTVDSAVFVSAALLAGLFGKENAVTVVPVVLAVALTAKRGALAAWFAARRYTVLSGFGTVTAYAVYRTYLNRAGLDDIPVTLEHRGVVDRLLRTCRFLTRTTVDGLLPFSWSPDYAPDPPASPWWILPFAGIVAVLVVLARGSRLPRAISAGIAVALVGALPMIPLVGPVNETADRYVFVSTLGGAIVWGTLLERGTRRLAVNTCAAAFVLLIAPLAFLSHRAAAPWRSDTDLWRAALERAPTSPRAWTAWSGLLRNRGDLDGADAAVARAIALGPRAIRPRVTRVYNLLARGKVLEAKDEIARLEQDGYGWAKGLRHARRCAELSQVAAAACIGESEKRRPRGNLSTKPPDPVPRDDTE